MRNDVVKQLPRWRTIAAASIAGLTILAVSTGALAHDGGGRKWKHHGRHFAPPGQVYYAPSGYYAPRYYAPRPVVYPAPVYYAPAPAYYPPSGLNFNFNVP